MIKVLFGDIKTGRLQRLPFLGYTLLLGLLLIGMGFGTMAAVTGAEMALGGDLASAQEMIMQNLAVPYLILFAIFIAALFAAWLNLMAKRARDAGLPGWQFVAGIIVFLLVVSWLFSQQASQTMSTIVSLGLLLVPSNSFDGFKLRR